MDAYYPAMVLCGMTKEMSSTVGIRTSTAVNKGSGLPIQNPSSDLADKKVLGNMNPDFSLGSITPFTYHSFSLSFQFDGRVGGKIYDRVYLQMTNGGTAADLAGNTAAGQASLKEWQSTNQGANAPTPAFVGAGCGYKKPVRPPIPKGVLTQCKGPYFGQE